MPRLRREIYLDNNATTKVSKSVLKRVNYVLKHLYGNPSSLYKIARNSAEVLEESRIQVAEAINAQPHEIYFTGSATEANNAILKSLSIHSYPEKNKIISTPIEHSSIMGTFEFLEAQGMVVEYCPVDNKGRINIGDLESMIDGKTFLACCMLANNELGTIQDVGKISQIAKKRGIYVMSDCVQALGKIRVDVMELGIDYASFSAHKLHGPKGIGALFVKESRPFSAFIHGGHQEGGMRAGTEGIHNIAGFGSACCDISEMLGKSEDILKVKQYFIEELRRIKQDIIVNSPEKKCLPNTVSITFPKVNNAVFIATLDYHGICVSAGSACNTSDNSPSHVLKAIGLTDDQARETIRFSLSTETNEDDINYALRIIKEYLENEDLPIDMITPAQLTEDILFSDRNYILDVRFWHDRKVLKGLPNSYEASFVFIKKYVDKIPKDKNILVVCQGGSNAAIVAYYLRSRGYGNVSFLLGGVIGWRMSHDELYKKYAGQNIVKLEPM